MKKICLGLVLFLVLLSSCQSMKVPEPKSENATQLLVKVTTEMEADFEYFASYKFILDNGESFLVQPAEGYQHIKTIPVGKQKIVGIQSYYKESGKLSNLHEINIPVEMSPKTITVFPIVLGVTVTEHPEKEGWFSQGYNLAKLTDSEFEEAKNYLNEFENIIFWKIQE